MAADPREIARDVALEEVRQLQGIVNRHEDQAFKVRGFMYVLLAALAVPFFAKDQSISAGQFVVAATALVVLFGCVELVHRAFVRFAILRGQVVELQLRGGAALASYDGPQIAIAMRQWYLRLLRTMGKELNLPSVSIHYFALFVSVALVGEVARREFERPPTVRYTYERAGGNQVLRFDLREDDGGLDPSTLPAPLKDALTAMQFKPTSAATAQAPKAGSWTDRRWVVLLPLLPAAVILVLSIAATIREERAHAPAQPSAPPTPPAPVPPIVSPVAPPPPPANQDGGAPA